VVCWGGHSIGREEYDYTKEVGYELGLRGLDICTGCGPGAMKGPMKGATIGHAKQRIGGGRYVGMTEPGIIAAEPPNPIVNQLVILPDIEKRLEAFVRLATDRGVSRRRGHGRGDPLPARHPAAPRQRQSALPGGFHRPAGGGPYFEQIDAFIGTTLGARPSSRYKIIIEDPQGVAREMRTGLEAVGGLPAAPTWTPTSSTGSSRSTGDLPAAVRGDPRDDGAPAPASRTSRCTSSRQPAARVLRHRRRQRQGGGHPRHRVQIHAVLSHRRLTAA
jgi:predicted Rossmann-fold nucleotide-binding protein